MARRIRTKSLDLLLRQLTYSPAKVRRGIVSKGEAFVPLVDPDKEYPYDFVVNKLTGHRPETRSDEILSGQALLKDLAQLIGELAETLDIDAAAIGEPVLDVGQAATIFQVSAKTVYRWNRDRGLVGYRMRFDDGQKKLGIRRSEAQRFATANADLVKDASSFTKLTPAERDAIVKKARELSATGQHGFCEVTRLVSQAVGRAPETIRTLLKKHDQEHPKKPIFPGVTPPLDEDNAQHIVQLYRDGQSLNEIARRFNRNKSTIHRILYKAKAAELMSMKIRVVFHPDFDKRAYRHRMSSTDIIAETKDALVDPKQGRFKNPLRGDTSIPTYFKDLFNSKILSREQEEEVFKAFNYFKYRTEHARQQIKGYTPTAAAIRKVEQFHERAVELKKFIVASNLRLVVSIAKKHLGPNIDFAQLISDGNLSLIKACETFDYSRGNRFSTYASWAVMKNFARSIPEENYLLKAYQPVEPELIEEARRDEAEEMPHYEYLANLRQGLLAVINRLDDREREIVINRYGLNPEDRHHTLEDIGAAFNLSKERIRQIEVKAIEKIRDIIVTEEVELMS